MISRNGRKLRIFSSAFPSLFPSLCFRAPRPIRRRPRVIFNPAPRRRPLQAIRLPPRLTSRPVRSPRELLARPTARKRAPSSRRKCPVPAACIINSIKMTTRAMVHASYKSNYWLIAWKVDFGADEMMLTMDMIFTSYSIQVEARDERRSWNLKFWRFRLDREIDTTFPVGGLSDVMSVISSF